MIDFFILSSSEYGSTRYGDCYLRSASNPFVVQPAGVTMCVRATYATRPSNLPRWRPRAGKTPLQMLRCVSPPPMPRLFSSRSRARGAPERRGSVPARLAGVAAGSRECILPWKPVPMASLSPGTAVRYHATPLAAHRNFYFYIFLFHFILFDFFSSPFSVLALFFHGARARRTGWLKITRAVS